jgi:Ca-activated chloride channel family protein
MSSIVDLSLATARPGLVAGRENVVDVLVRVQAPDAPKTGLPERPQLNLALVIDRSGSMSGEPLHEAKRCAALMIEGLKASDRASVVAYDDTVQVFAESQPVKSKEKFKAAIAHIHEGGTTNLHGGWLKGAEEAAQHLDPTVVSRVLLLSDGNANAGLTNLDEIASQCAQLADSGVTTSTYGLGQSFNEDLMMALARAGRGNGYYSDTAESLLERFREEFSLLASLCARDVRLCVTPLPGIRFELLNLYERTKDGAWRLPDLVYDGEAWAAIRLHVNPTALPAVGETVAILQASVSFRDLTGSESEVPESWLSLPVLTEEAFRVLPEDESVARRFHEAEAARLQEFASRAARQGDWNRVDGLLAQVRSLAANSPWLNEVVMNLERLAAQRNDVLFSKEAQYAAASMSARVRHKMESAALSDEGTLPRHLQRKIRQGAKGKDGAE